MVSVEMETVIEQLKTFQASTAELSVEVLRLGLDQLASMATLPDDVTHEPIEAGGVPAEWVTISDSSVSNNVILYLHGGGYVSGSIKTHIGLGARIARGSKARVLMIDYRLGPENPFPAALEDAIAAYHWLVNDEGINPTNIVIAGDSAGGGLTLACLVKLRDTEASLPVAAVCLSPWTDLANTGETIRTKAELDPFITPEGVEFMAKKYLGESDSKDPLASPLYANLQGLPPLLIQVGTSEILLDDSIRFSDRAKAAGVEVQLAVWDDMIHVFAAFAEWAPEGRQAIDQICEFIGKYLT